MELVAGLVHDQHDFAGLDAHIAVSCHTASVRRGPGHKARSLGHLLCQPQPLCTFEITSGPGAKTGGHLQADFALLRW